VQFVRGRQSKVRDVPHTTPISWYGVPLNTTSVVVNFVGLIVELSLIATLEDGLELT
jgi:hypothetical protein